MIPEPLLLSGIVLLWLLLLFLLARGAYRAYGRGKRAEAIVLGIAAAVLIVSTGPYALFFAWAAGCGMGWPLSCMV
jgi:hypothetical protein